MEGTPQGSGGMGGWLLPVITGALSLIGGWVAAFFKYRESSEVGGQDLVSVYMKEFFELFRAQLKEEREQRQREMELQRKRTEATDRELVRMEELIEELREGLSDGAAE